MDNFVSVTVRVTPKINTSWKSQSLAVTTRRVPVGIAFLQCYNKLMVAGLK